MSDIKKVRQGEQNVLVSYKRGGHFHSDTRLCSQSQTKNPKLSKQDKLNPHSLSRVEWAIRGFVGGNRGSGVV
ncbi:hypothetical protein Sps_01485 [Shewanella psychrophila]|uniref:Uncharacterized protein n=1 Tax=Shewanella psychrophila TaxID=225848 RepID=A0A1S6HM97_9GAMM|nr:hypothetical protein [Shewanella psychrophila]AQS36651.1 hypothetical protein Sps_01485 [Shewanella psychrophila]